MKELQVRSFNFGKVYEAITKQWIENKNYDWYEEGKLYVTTIDLFEYIKQRPITKDDYEEYEEFRNKLLDESVKSSTYTYYNEETTNPDEYEFIFNNNWYRVSDILEVI